MQTSVLIAGLVLLIPFVYASTSIPDACAEIRDTNYDSGSCTGDKTSKAGKTCCWREKVPGQLLGKTICQTCWTESDSKGSYERCTSPTEQAFKLPETDRANPLQKGGVLEKQNDLPKFNQEDSKLGTILEEQKSNVTFSEQNASNDSSNDNLAMKQSDLVSDEIQNTTTAEGDKEKQDESNTTEEPNEDNAEDAKN